MTATNVEVMNGETANEVESLVTGNGLLGTTTDVDAKIVVQTIAGNVSSYSLDYFFLAFSSFFFFAPISLSPW